MNRPTPREIVDASPHAAVAFDPTLVIRAVNDRALVCFGRSRDDLLGMPLEVLFAERARDAYVEHVRAAFHRPERADAELEVFGLRGGATEVPLSLALSRVTSRDGAVMLASFRGPAATERSDATSASAQLLAALPDVLLVVDANGVIELASRPIPGLFGDGVVGRSAFERVGVDGRRQLAVAMEHASRERASASFEVSRSDAEGARHTFVCRVVPMPDAPRFLLIVGEGAEARAAVDERAAVERNEWLGTLAAGLAHEINNPLTAVIANLDFAIEELGEEEDVEPSERAPVVAALRDARIGANRVRDLVRDVKMLSSADDQHRELVDVQWVVESSLELASEQILARARIVRSYANTPPVECNSGRLGQALLHLFSNAAEAIPEGNADSNEVRVTTSVDVAGRVIVEIEDTGAGIAPEDLPRLFTPFFTRKAPGRGTGLGLAICQRIVTEAGGEVEVESRLGVGTLVRVVLPSVMAGENRKPKSSGVRMRALPSSAAGRKRKRA